MEVTNRFKELDLIDRVKNYGWKFMTVQEAVIKTILKKKKCKKTKWLSEEALQIAVKRRETRGKGEEERVPKKSKQIRKPSSMTNAKK